MRWQSCRARWACRHPAAGSRVALLPDADDRTLKRQRAEIRSLLGFREATVADAEDLGA